MRPLHSTSPTRVSSPKRLSPQAAVAKRSLGTRTESYVKLAEFDGKKQREARRSRRQSTRAYKWRCTCVVLAAAFAFLGLNTIFPYGILRVVQYEVLTEWRLGRAGATNMFAGPLSLITGEDEWRVIFLTRCPKHACRGCHYELAAPTDRGNGVSQRVEVTDTSVVNSALGLYTVHEAIFSGDGWGSSPSYKVHVRDAARRSRQADEEAAHIRCPAEGFKVPGLALPRPGAHASIAFIADNQFLVYRFKRLLRHIEARSPDLLLHLGDAVQHGWSEREWLKDFMWPLQDSGLVPSTPMLIAKGNHDVDGHTAVEFAPSRRTRGDAVVMVGDLRVIFLDTAAETDAQVRWLEAQLSLTDPKTAASHRHDTIICGHIPPYIEYWDPVVWNRAVDPESSWDVYMRERIVPVIEASDLHRRKLIKMVLGGHSHIYQRGERNGITYVIMGGGGATLESPLERVANWSMYDKTLFVHHYGWLERRPGSAGWQWRVYDIHNVLIDTVNITGTGF